jgi:hypothetical protein
MNKIRSGCIQTILKSSGELETYRLTFPVPRQFVDQNRNRGNVAGLLIIPKVQEIRNRMFYVHESTDFSKIEELRDLAQLHVTFWKARMWTEKGDCLREQFAVNHICKPNKS